jgi:hypothetical protein
MARGAASKEIIKNKILGIFEGSFLYDGGKEIRIPIQEDGEIIQIKCVLTAAKTNVSNGADDTIPAVTEGVSIPQASQSVEPSAEEKQTVEELCAKLGLF